MSIILEGMFKSPNIYVEKTPIVAMAILKDGMVKYLRIDERTHMFLHEGYLMSGKSKNPIVSVIPITREMYALDIWDKNAETDCPLNGDMGIYALDDLAFSDFHREMPMVDFINYFMDYIKKDNMADDQISIDEEEKDSLLTRLKIAMWLIFRGR